MQFGLPRRKMRMLDDITTFGLIDVSTTPTVAICSYFSMVQQRDNAPVFTTEDHLKLLVQTDLCSNGSSFIRLAIGNVITIGCGASNYSNNNYATLIFLIHPPFLILFFHVALYDSLCSRIHRPRPDAASVRRRTPRVGRLHV